MKLLNDYKVIYSAYREGELHGYATKKLPAADDVALTYINEEGTELSAEDIKAIKLVYSKGESLYYSLTGFPAEDDHKLFVYCEDELVFGEEDAPTPAEKYQVEVAAITHAVITGAGKYAEGANVKITLKAANGYRFAEGNAPKINDEDLAKEGNKFVYEFVMGTEAVSIEIADVLIEKIPEPVPTPKYAVTVQNIEGMAFSGTGEFEEGEEVTILIRTKNGYQWAAGNAPKVNGVALEAVSGNKFKYTFNMPAEAVTVVFEDVLIEEIPAPATPKVYYYMGEDKLTEFDANKFEAEDFDESATFVEHTYATYVDSYYAIAVPASKPIQHIYQNGLESFDVLEMFEEHQINVGNDAYRLYVTVDIHVAEIEHDTFKFVF